jgi:hypothetical protein
MKYLRGSTIWIKSDTGRRKAIFLEYVDSPAKYRQVKIINQEGRAEIVPEYEVSNEEKTNDD